ncbi:MAG: transcription elongation factor GreA [Firmicutes bacterium]|nr:transcription elongation factor GreA [Bacillota bacterium]
MSEKEVLVSREGLKKMEQDLENLKTVRRQEVAARIKQAIEFGDISENSEYDDAKNEQAFIEGSIIDLEKKLRNAKIIDDISLDVEIISVGSTVKIRNTKDNKEYTYQIVGSVDANPSAGKISNESPVGAALLAHQAGDIVDVNVPAGVISFEILEIGK